MDYINYSGVFTNNNGRQNIIERMVVYDDKRNPSIIAVTNNNGSIKYGSIKTRKPKNNKKIRLKSIRKPKKTKRTKNN
jgi:hypothetical protein